jgi:AAA15 family ATPase/GTPase
MYLSKFQLVNYKSFRDSGVLEFKPGINIIVGTNNSGKTALLEALSLSFQNHIHKTLTTFPLPSDIIANSHSCCQLSLSVKKESLQFFVNNLSTKVGNNILITVPDQYRKEQGYLSQSFYNFFESEKNQDIEIQIRVRGSGDAIPFDSIPNFFSSFYNTKIENFLQYDDNHYNKQYYGVFNINDQKNVKAGSFGQTIQYEFFQKYRRIIYKFDAERLNLGTSLGGTDCVLKPNASNLAEVLSNLQTKNPNRFKRFNEYVSTVIPSVKGVTAPRSDDNSNVGIEIWTVDPATERDDLSYPLSHCGTGVSQVLAILYVVITSQESRIIILDEPQSFLHPGAAKKLIEILKQFPQHQYFISTHSPSIITAANPSTIIKLWHEDNETKTFVMNSGNIKEQKELLSELGVNLSDVFGADKIVWVEGLTEEQCFPIILEKIAKKPQGGIQFLAVKSTSDLLEAKNNKSITIAFDVYDKLSGGSSLFPPAIGFIFDSELRNDVEKNKLMQKSRNSVHFLPRRMYENYLLHSKAIAFIINKYDKELQAEPISDHIIQEWIDKEKNEISYFDSKNSSQVAESDWLCKIDGSIFLHKLFSTLAPERIDFKGNKAKYSREITEWLIDNEPEYLFKLSEFLVTCLSETAINKG